MVMEPIHNRRIARNGEVRADGKLVDTIDAKSMIAKIVRILGSNDLMPVMRKSNKIMPNLYLILQSVEKGYLEHFPYNGKNN